MKEKDFSIIFPSLPSFSNFTSKVSLHFISFRRINILLSRKVLRSLSNIILSVSTDHHDLTL